MAAPLSQGKSILISPADPVSDCDSKQRGYFRMEKMASDPEMGTID